MYDPVSGRPTIATRYAPSMTEKILLGGWCVGTVVAVGMLLVATTWRIQNWKRHPVVRVSRMLFAFASVFRTPPLSPYTSRLIYLYIYILHGVHVYQFSTQLFIACDIDGG